MKARVPEGGNLGNRTFIGPSESAPVRVRGGRAPSKTVLPNVDHRKRAATA
jgi:hypothetical protein